jgi:hypothetical protein
MSDPGVGHVRIAYWNPASEPDIPGELEKLEWPRHVRAGGGHVRQSLLEPGQETGYVWIFLASWFGNMFSIICTSPAHSMHPP